MPRCGVRWRALFQDLEAQAAALERAELDAEVSDRTRREAGLVRLVDRLRPAAGAPLVVQVLGAGVLRGVLLDAGAQWLLLDEGAGREVLVPVDAVLSVAGLGRAAAAPGSEGEVERRLDLRWALRGLARDRAPLAVVLRDGTTVTGTLDRVGADHVELAEHAAGEVRRAAAVRAVRLLPLSGLAALRRA